MSEPRTLFEKCKGELPVFPRAIDGNAIEKFIVDGLNAKKFGCDCVEILTEVHYAPTIDPEELRPKGRWIGKQLDNFRKYQVTCSECGWIGIENYDSYNEPSEFNYCPNCGAKMEEDK